MMPRATRMAGRYVKFIVYLCSHVEVIDYVRVATVGARRGERHQESNLEPHL